MLTKHDIETCNDGQQLADWAAEYCMGLHLIDYSYPFSDGYDYATEKAWTNNNGRVWFVREPYENPDVWGGGLSIWQPHQPTEKGKSQCWDLMEKYKSVLSIEYVVCKWVATLWVDGVGSKVMDMDFQVTVLKAALLSEITE